MEFYNKSSEGTPIGFQQTLVEYSHERLVRILVTFLMSLIFVYVNSLMFHTLLSKPVFRELPRYILFAHMLCNDTVQLLLSTVFFLLFTCWQKIPRAICSLLIFLSATTTNISPLNLGVMSLERYVAICFPLRHSEMATKKMSGVSISIMWFLGSISVTTDILYTLIVNPLSFKNSMYCAREMFVFSQWQNDLNQGLSSFFFVAVTGVIFFTYISVILAARSASADKDSAKKAWKTVLLHFGQLILCLNSLLYIGIEKVLAMVRNDQLFLHLRILIYIVFLILPRCLSPLIYGLRDDAVRPLFLYYVRCGSQKVKPSVTAH